MACLLIVSGEPQGNYYRLTKRPLTGGRDPATDIQIIDPKVSRRHFQVALGKDGYVIRELRSRNGVFVNGTRITGDHKLEHGDEIRVGQSVLAFYTDDHPDKTDALQKYKRADRELREDRTIGD